MRGFFIRCGITGFAVVLASQIIPGIEIISFGSGVVAVVILSFLNAILRPLLYLLSAPFILVTLGFFMVLINAFLLYLVVGRVDSRRLAMHRIPLYRCNKLELVKIEGTTPP